MNCLVCGVAFFLQQLNIAKFSCSSICKVWLIRSWIDAKVFFFQCIWFDFQVLCTPSPQGRKLPQEEVWPQQRGETYFLISLPQVSSLHHCNIRNTHYFVDPLASSLCCPWPNKSTVLLSSYCGPSGYTPSLQKWINF